MRATGVCRMEVSRTAEGQPSQGHYFCTECFRGIRGMTPTVENKAPTGRSVPKLPGDLMTKNQWWLWGGGDLHSNKWKARHEATKQYPHCPNQERHSSDVHALFSCQGVCNQMWCSTCIGVWPIMETADGTAWKFWCQGCADSQGGKSRGKRGTDTPPIRSTQNKIRKDSDKATGSGSR